MGLFNFGSPHGAVDPMMAELAEIERRRNAIRAEKLGIKVGQEVARGGQALQRAPRVIGRAGVSGLQQFRDAAVQQREPFSQEQYALKELFGGGQRIWGWRMQPVEINNDLNPRQQGDHGTASLFGFGPRSRGSGLF